MHTAVYHGILLRAVPRPCARALEIGCGTGAFSRALSTVVDHVDAVDRDPEVIERARAASAGIANLRYVCSDFVTLTAQEGGRYDFVCALASLHHLPFHSALDRIKALLRPSGVFGVIGLYRPSGAIDFATSLVALPASLWLRLTRPGVKERVPLRAPDLTLREIRAIARELAPGSVLKRRLLWRYTLVYPAPRASPLSNDGRPVALPARDSEGSRKSGDPPPEPSLQQAPIEQPPERR